MQTRHASIVIALAAASLAAIGCSKDSSPSGVTAVQGATGSTAATDCAAKMASYNPKAGPDEKKAYAAACAAVSPKAQACVASTKSDKDMDACLSDKADKEAFMGAALMGAAQVGAVAAKATGVQKLDKLGLQIDVPGEALVSAGMGANSAMVNSAAIGGVSIEEASSSTPKTLKAAKSDAQLFKPRDVQGEQTADGYWLTFTNTGSAGTNYWVKSLHKIGGKTYTCEGVPDSADKAAAALAACKTLRPI